MASDSEQTFGPRGTRLLAEVLLAIGLAFGAAVLVTHINAATRLALGVGLGVLGFILLLRTALVVQQINAVTRLLGYDVNKTTGVLLKGRVRNVALRLKTITTIIDELADGTAGATSEERLKKAGLSIGESWGEEFVQISRKEASAGSLAEKLELWSDYDATAGFGRFEFRLSQQGHGCVVLTNGFLSEEKHACNLDLFVAGYLEGTLGKLLGHQVDVTVIQDTNDVAEYLVSPMPVPVAPPAISGPVPP